METHKRAAPSRKVAVDALFGRRLLAILKMQVWEGEGRGSLHSLMLQACG